MLALQNLHLRVNICVLYVYVSERLLYKVRLICAVLKSWLSTVVVVLSRNIFLTQNDDLNATK